jgi:hypothetical protein
MSGKLSCFSFNFLDRLYDITVEHGETDMNSGIPIYEARTTGPLTRLVDSQTDN